MSVQFKKTQFGHRWIVNCPRHGAIHIAFEPEVAENVKALHDLECEAT